MITRYPTLQSGFLGYPGEALLKRPEVVPHTPIQMLISPPPHRTQQEYFYSPAFDQFYADIINNPLKLRDFKVQAELFKILGALFDRKGFFNWMRIQEDGENISFLHAQFLEDTLAAVVINKRRLYEPAQWATMLSAANDPLTKPFRAAQVTERAGVRPPDDLTSFLASWVEGPGWSDLLMSMQVIFGRRTLPASYGAPTS